jgi:hypothetical protein
MMLCDAGYIFIILRVVVGVGCFESVMSATRFLIGVTRTLWYRNDSVSILSVAMEIYNVFLHAAGYGNTDNCRYLSLTLQCIVTDRRK